MQILALNDSWRRNPQFQRLSNKMLDYPPANCNLLLFRPSLRQIDGQFRNHIQKHVSKFGVILVDGVDDVRLGGVLLLQQNVQPFLLFEFISSHLLLHLMASLLQTGYLVQKFLLRLLFCSQQLLLDTQTVFVGNYFGFLHPFLMFLPKLIFQKVNPLLQTDIFLLNQSISQSQLLSPQFLLLQLYPILHFEFFIYQIMVGVRIRVRQSWQEDRRIGIEVVYWFDVM